MIATNGLVDFHCHLDLYPDFQAIVRETDKAGVFTLAVTTTPRAWARNNELAQTTRRVRAALGLHPQLVAERANEISLWESYIDETRYVGEVGLDAGPRFYKSLELQQQIFERILRRCAVSGDKIISVHSVRAVKAVLDHIEKHLPPNRGKIVLHWFTGTKSEAQRAVDMGCYFSINLAMLQNTRHSSIIATIPLNRLLTETDGPFTMTSDHPSKPSDVIFASKALGRIKGLPTTTLVDRIRENLTNLIGE